MKYIWAIFALFIFSGNAESLNSLLKDKNLIFSDDLKNAYLSYCEKEIFDELSLVGVKLNQEQILFLKSNSKIYEACFGSVYPPDPRIALNILEIKNDLGEVLFKDYMDLVIAGAVVRRYVGVAEATLGEKEEWALRYKSKNEYSGKSRFWPVYKLFKIQRPQKVVVVDQQKKKSPPARVIKKRKAKFENSKLKLTNAEGQEIVYQFLKSKNVTPKELLASTELKKELEKKMGNLAPVGITYQMLYQVMTSKGLRPPKRDPFPSFPNFIRYLSKIKPAFPVKSSPWPVLMPLAKGWPLREAADIWNNYHKTGKMRTYGKYRKKELVIQSRLEPLKWHWQSWQGTYQAGGVCHEMSTIGLGTFMSLGIPSQKAGQPHHSCVVIYRKTEKGYVASIKQGTTGPSNTHSQWLFADPKVECNMSHHIGLALSMNLGLQRFIDSRIGINIYKYSKDKATLPGGYLKSILLKNYYNTEAWNLLSEQEHSRIQLLSFLNKVVKSSAGESVVYEEKAINQALKEQTEKISPDKLSGSYIEMLSKNLKLLEFKPSGNKSDKQILEALKQMQGSALNVNAKIFEYEISINGWLTVKEECLKLAEQYVAEKKSVTFINNTVLKIQYAAEYAENKDDLLEWLLELEKISSKRMLFKKRPRTKKIYGDPLYRVIISVLQNTYESVGQKQKGEQYIQKLKTKISTAK